MRTTSIESVIAKAKPSEEVISLLDELKESRKKLAQYKKEHGNIESIIHQVVAAAGQVTPQLVLPKIEVPKKSVCTSPVDECLQLSDIHYGAIQEPDEVEGFGRFSPEIAKDRMRSLFKLTSDWTIAKRNSYNVKNLHILCTGDMISGDIHDELRITNAFPAPVQAVECGVMLSEFIAGYSPFFENVIVHFVCDDNHGRLTRKPQAKQGGMNNYGYIVGRWIQASLSGIKNVKVHLITGPWESVECCGRRYLLSHGHHVSGWAGFPYYGIERLVAREAMKRMNAADIRKFHKVVIGHWHAPLTHPNYWIGGSLSGTDAFDHGQGRCSAPCQVSWMIHPKHGEFDRTEWNLA